MAVNGKKIKVVELSKLLTAGEAELFTKSLAGHKRKSTLHLYRYISGLRSAVITTEDKKALFKAVFGKAYTADKDYLLRNELRLLNIALENFIAVNEAGKEPGKNKGISKKYFLNYLLDKKAYGLFQSEVTAAISMATAENDYNSAAEMQRQHIEYLVYNKEATTANFTALLDKLENYYQLASSAFLHNYIYMQHKKAFTERTLQALGNGNIILPVPSPVTDLHSRAQNDRFLNYMLLLTESYRLRGAEKIKVLEDARRLIPRIAKKDFDKKAGMATTAGGIGLEYFLLGDYEKSVFYHKAALSHSATLTPERAMALAFNYLSSLIRLENYASAIRVIDRYRTTWEKLPRLQYRFLCLKAMCHLFNREHKLAVKCIPYDRKKGGPDHYYYFRYIQIISYYLRGEIQLALNETDNFERTVRYQGWDKHYLSLTVLMKRFLKLFESKINLGAKEFRQNAKLFLGEINLRDIEQQQPDKALLYKWIYREVNTLSGK